MRIQWGAFVSLEKGSKNKNTCSRLLREESVYIKKMSLSLDYFCLRRATVCYSGLIWSCCGFLEFSPHIPCSGLLIFSSGGVKSMWSKVAKTCWKCWSVGTIFWLVLVFWGRHAKNCAIMSIFLGYFWSNLHFKFWRNSCLQTLTTLSILVSNTNNPNTKHSENWAWLISKRKCEYCELVGGH